MGRFIFYIASFDGCPLSNKWQACWNSKKQLGFICNITHKFPHYILFIFMSRLGFLIFWLWCKFSQIFLFVLYKVHLDVVSHVYSCHIFMWQMHSFEGKLPNTFDSFLDFVSAVKVKMLASTAHCTAHFSGSGRCWDDLSARQVNSRTHCCCAETNTKIIWVLHEGFWQIKTSDWVHPIYLIWTEANG